MFAPRPRVLSPARLASPASLLAAAVALALALVGLGALAAATMGLARDAAGIGAPPRSATAQPSASDAAFAGPYEAEALRVIDGDSFVARLQVWFGQQAVVTVRLRGVDAPETAARCADEARRAAAATQALAEMLAGGRVRLTHLSRDKYFGRVVADATVVSPEAAFPDTELGPALIAAGLARPYDGRARTGWCGRLAARALASAAPLQP